LYALAFYTGSGSDYVSAAAAVETQKLDHNLDSSKYETDKYASILYFMILALSHIPYYWGETERWINLKEEDEDYDMYERGNVVTWLQFSSSAMKQQGEISAFKTRNTKFNIWSLKGRDISRFSEISSEKEVLFTPFTRFLVLDKKENRFKKPDGTWNDFTEIWMREVEVGLFDARPILWVDDNIFNKDWENKTLMEDAQKIIDLNVRFICKPTTELAMAYLASLFGQRAKNNPNFRIMSDMTRKSKDSGAKFMAQAIQAGFNTQKKMIFTSNKANGEAYCKNHGVEVNSNCVVTVNYNDAQNFITYK